MSDDRRCAAERTPIPPETELLARIERLEQALRRLTGIETVEQTRWLAVQLLYHSPDMPPLSVGKYDAVLPAQLPSLLGAADARGHTETARQIRAYIIGKKLWLDEEYDDQTPPDSL